MTTASQAAARILEALEAGPTPGDWKPDLADVLPGERDIEPATSRLNGGFIIGRLSGSDRAANVAYIAACSPDNLRALLAERDELREALSDLTDHCERLRDPAKEVRAARAALNTKD